MTPLTLANFEQVIEKGVLQKGRQYYKNGAVTALEETDDNAWSATVVGSEDYTVTVAISTSGEVESECDCPYDWGPYCKHEVAVLLALRDRLAQPDAAKRKSTQKQAKDNLRKTLEALSKEQLIELVLKAAKKDKLFANEILLEHSAATPDKSGFIQIINAYIRAEQDRGYLDYTGTRRVASHVDKLITQAETLINNGQGGRALPILQAVVEAIQPAMDQADDSSGDLGACIEAAYDAMEETIPSLSEAEQHELFDYCITLIEGKSYSGFDYEWSPASIAAALVRDDTGRNRFFAALEQRVLHTSAWARGFAEETVLRYKLEVLKALGTSDTELFALLRDHLHLDGVRKQVIEQYIAEGKYAEANALCVEALKRYEQTQYHGLVRQYRNLLIKIAKVSKNNDGLIQLSRESFIETGQFTYYEELKQIIPPAQWRETVLSMAAEFQKKPTPHTWTEVLAELYSREAMWKALFKLVQPDNMRLLIQYRQPLFEQYPDECGALYERHIYQAMDRATQRDEYRAVTALLGHLRQHGEDERAEHIKEALITRYPKRRAMIEELRRS